ncbi:hypothetical protein MNO14_14380 [Luteimonas sp. S4-F44]|nr:RHS repeat-associated core domain-containing protein [Luteimonas sp. S4-F44]UNK44188.1 hypothetical protein MNO14_14380 [Luteimonas sp. S4-F44]
MGSEPIGLVRDGQLYFTHTDRLGRPEVVSDGNQSPRWLAANHAYDRAVLSSSIGDYNLGLPGQYYDAETGFWYNGFRDYDGRTGTYLQSDPIGLRGGANTYSYVSGNPINAIDPLGLVGYICRRGENVGIAIPINFKGATPEQVGEIARNIESRWSGRFGSLNVKTVVLPQAVWDPGNANQVAVNAGSDTSWVETSDRNWGVWYMSNSWGGATFAHEAGHLLGLDHGSGIMKENGLSGDSVNEQNVRDVLAFGNSYVR